MSAPTRNIGEFFIKQDVQRLLKSLAGLDLNKVFRSTFNVKLRPGKIQLLSEEELKESQEKSLKKAYYLMQMPPVLEPRKPCDHVIVKDEKLNLFNTTNTKYTFIDISMNVPNSKRKIVVREADGTLRHASWKEREKMLQIYYPSEGRTFVMPKMFKSDILEERLLEKKYLFLLDKACAQFEPDDPEFIRVTHRIYEVINTTEDYEYLKSTRFFGPMVFYLTWYKKLNNLIAYNLKNMNLQDCVHLIYLYYILHPDRVNNPAFKDKSYLSFENLELVKIFIKSELVDQEKVEIALTNYINESKEKQKEAAHV